MWIANKLCKSVHALLDIIIIITDNLWGRSRQFVCGNMLAQHTMRILSNEYQLRSHTKKNDCSENARLNYLGRLSPREIMLFVYIVIIICSPRIVLRYAEQSTVKWSPSYVRVGVRYTIWLTNANVIVGISHSRNMATCALHKRPFNDWSIVGSFIGQSYCAAEDTHFARLLDSHLSAYNISRVFYILSFTNGLRADTTTASIHHIGSDVLWHCPHCSSDSIVRIKCVRTTPQFIVGVWVCACSCASVCAVCTWKILDCNGSQQEMPAGHRTIACFGWVR